MYHYAHTPRPKEKGIRCRSSAFWCPARHSRAAWSVASTSCRSHRDVAEVERQNADAAGARGARRAAASDARVASTTADAHAEVLRPHPRVPPRATPVARRRRGLRLPRRATEVQRACLARVTACTAASTATAGASCACRAAGRRCSARLARTLAGARVVVQSMIRDQWRSTSNASARRARGRPARAAPTRSCPSTSCSPWCSRWPARLGRRARLGRHGDFDEATTTRCR